MNYFLVIGYGWSGSSALVDLLKEYECNFSVDIEFRLIKDSKGIHDLYDTIVNKWDPLNVDIAVRDFKWFINHLYVKNSKLSLYRGLDYCSYFGKSFKYASEEFISDIVEFNYESYWWYLDFIKNTYQILIRKIGNRLGINKNSMFFSAIDEEKFIAYTHKYINAIFSSLSEVGKCKNIILDQAISANNCLTEMKFIPNSKVVIVDRDPRDIYADLISDGNLIGKELQKTHDVSKYIKWHNALRVNLARVQEHNNILVIYFEDLVLDTNKTKRKIEEFLGLNSTFYTNAGQFFKPKISQKNVGIWRNLITDIERREIELALKDYLWQ